MAWSNNTSIEFWEETNMNKREKQVVEVLEDLCLAEITELSQTLLGDLAMDSLRMVMLLVSLEDTFGIELDESDMNPFALVTVADVVNLVSKYAPETEES